MHFTVCITPANIRPPKMNKLKALKNINTLFNSHHHPCLDVHIIPVMLVYYQVSIPISTCEIKFLHDCRFSKPIDNSVHFDSSYFSKNERRCKRDMNPHLWYREYQRTAIVLLRISSHYKLCFLCELFRFIHWEVLIPRHFYPVVESLKAIRAKIHNCWHVSKLIATLCA